MHEHITLSTAKHVYKGVHMSSLGGRLSDNVKENSGSHV